MFIAEKEFSITPPIKVFLEDGTLVGEDFFKTMAPYSSFIMLNENEPFPQMVTESSILLSITLPDFLSIIVIIITDPEKGYCAARMFERCEYMNHSEIFCRWYRFLFLFVQWWTNSLVVRENFRMFTDFFSHRSLFVYVRIWSIENKSHTRDEWIQVLFRSVSQWEKKKKKKKKFCKWTFQIYS